MTDNVAPKNSRPTRSRPQPWVVVRHHRSDPTDRPEWVYGRCPTEQGARRYVERLRRTFEQAHRPDENQRWAWAAVHDPDITIRPRGVAID